MALATITLVALRAGLVSRNVTKGEDLHGPINSTVRLDDVAYAKAFSVSETEAHRRLGLQHEMRGMVDQLTTAAPARLSGIWYEHEPEFKLVV